MEYKGIGISNGKAIGKAFIINDFDHLFSQDHKASKKEMVEKLSYVLLNVIKEYDSTKNEGKNNIVIDACKEIISSSSLYEKLTNLIIDNDYNVINAVEKVLNDKKNELSSLDNEYVDSIIRELDNIKKDITSKLLEYVNQRISKIEYDFILICKEITPSMILSADAKYIKGIICEKGGVTSHVAVICRNMGLPGIINVPNLESLFSNDDVLYIDGSKGSVINDLTSDDIKNYYEEIKKYKNISGSLEEMQNKKAKTLDDKSFNVTSNISNIDDLGHLISIKSDGVGLLRSEFLYLNRTTPPSEELQYKTYKSFAMSLKDKPLIIRTFDLNGDKKSFSNNKEVLKTQLRAILKASDYGNVMIMYPMISNIEEVRNANIILREAMSELQEEEISYNKDIKIGITVEVPSVAIMADAYIDEVDFLSVGTNDLIKYTIASDREHTFANSDDDIYNPAILRILKNIIDSKKDGKVISICGEIATNPLYIIVLVGLGIDELSVNVNSILKVKKYISLLNYEECKKITEHILTLKTNTKIREYLENYAKEVFNIYLEM